MNPQPQPDPDPELAALVRKYAIRGHNQIDSDEVLSLRAVSIMLQLEPAQLFHAVRADTFPPPAFISEPTIRQPALMLWKSVDVAAHIRKQARDAIKSERYADEAYFNVDPRHRMN
jgi:hypothetical protein